MYPVTHCVLQMSTHKTRYEAYREKKARDEKHKAAVLEFCRKILGDKKSEPSKPDEMCPHCAGLLHPKEGCGVWRNAYLSEVWELNRQYYEKKEAEKTQRLKEIYL